MYKIIVKGTVQGVGFRPFVYRGAKKNHIRGEVKNAGYGVEIIADKKKAVTEFLQHPPPLARIDSIEVQLLNIEKNNYDDFYIKKSESSNGETILPPDVFTCNNCLEELRDKNNRRHNYYFITCTDCGPRFSMIEDYPYDRPYTSMNDFEMCEECKKEYNNPLDRRYHAQTIACHKCGPRLKLLDKNNQQLTNSEEDTIKKAADLIKSGEPVAIKGVGGFHIACSCAEASVKKLRGLLRRENKPFAIMVKDEGMLKNICLPTEKEQELLKSPQRPIVVVKKKDKKDYKEVSELNSIGVMYPYTALHHLLFDHLETPVVMTSANLPGEPVLIEEDIAPYYLTHDRRIVNRCDDSVIKVIENNPIFLRRSRGYVPTPLKLPLPCKDTIALGSQSNNTITVAKKNKAFVSQHIGDCSKIKTMEFLKSATDKLLHLTRTSPEIIAVDMHPEYETKKYAKELSERFNAKIIQIQHHKAHLAGTAAEHGLKNYAGIATDGLGYGENGELWGGEIFSVKNNSEFKRAGMLQKQPMLGGDNATKDPKKMLAGILMKAGFDISETGLYTKEETRIYEKMFEEGFNVHYTTSTGRILDAVSALLELCSKATYEGRPAMLLESAVTKGEKITPVIKEDNGMQVLMTSTVFEYILNNKEKPFGELAYTAHMYLAEGFYKISSIHSDNIVLSGGVSYNKFIAGELAKKGVKLQTNLPPGDGGVSYGQCILANKKY